MGEKYPDDPGQQLLGVYLLDFIMQLSKGTLFNKYSDTWFTPHLDEETLAEDSLRSLSLLHARTAFEPEDWIMFDRWHLIIAEEHIVLIPEFNANCVVMQGLEYGMFVPGRSTKPIIGKSWPTTRPGRFSQHNRLSWHFCARLLMLSLLIVRQATFLALNQFSLNGNNCSVMVSSGLEALLQSPLLHT
jgi:hypothetical protein